MPGNKKMILVFPSLLFLSKDCLTSADKDTVLPQSEDFRVCQCVKWGRDTAVELTDLTEVILLLLAV